jgi:hypothetical protein
MQTNKFNFKNRFNIITLLKLNYFRKLKFKMYNFLLYNN